MTIEVSQKQLDLLNKHANFLLRKNRIRKIKLIKYKIDKITSPL